MSRPSARLITTTEVNEQFSIDILEANALYAVVYNNEPFNIKNRYFNVHGEFKKYGRTVFPSKKAAENLAAKLNYYFAITEFTVKRLI